jgi:Zn-dependent peptidase ImmA (M78 family)
MSRNEEIEELAELIAIEHWRNGRVDPREVAATSGLTFTFGHYEDHFDGLLECRAHRFHVYLNLDRHGSADSSRMRFSFAHELGHYFLDWHRHALEHGVPAHGSSSDFQSPSAIEREADLFAANLLLPREKLKGAARARIDAAEVQRLATLFGTSLSATAIRCALLDTSPLIVMGWTTAGRKWCWSSGQYRWLANKAYKAAERLVRESATWQTLEAPSKNSGSNPTRGTTLSAWFPGVFAGSSSDEVMLEECISLGRHGALTILRPS